MKINLKFKPKIAFYYDHGYGCLRFNAGNTEEEKETINLKTVCTKAIVDK
jgi:hypothetical protein